MNLRHAAVASVSFLAFSSLLAATPAFATCRIKNETKWSFTIESGNVSNQRVGSNTTTSIASGKVKAKSDDGKTFSASCKDGDELIVKDDKGIPVVDIK